MAYETKEKQNWQIGDLAEYLYTNSPRYFIVQAVAQYREPTAFVVIPNKGSRREKQPLKVNRNASIRDFSKI